MPDLVTLISRKCEVHIDAIGMKQFGGSLPLIHHPGEAWMYHTGTEVLSVLLARASGMPLDQFFREWLYILKNLSISTKIALALHKS